MSSSWCILILKTNHVNRCRHCFYQGSQVPCVWGVANAKDWTLGIVPGVDCVMSRLKGGAVSVAWLRQSWTRIRAWLQKSAWNRLWWRGWLRYVCAGTYGIGDSNLPGLKMGDLRILTCECGQLPPINNASSLLFHATTIISRSFLFLEINIVEVFYSRLYLWEPSLLRGCCGIPR